MKKAKSNTIELAPELVQIIATYVKSLKNLLTFLRAFPQHWLSKPLKSILRLNKAVQETRLGISFWPRFDVRTRIYDQDVSKPLKQALIVIPMVSVYSHHNIPLAPDTKIDLLTACSMNDIDFAMKKWCDRIVSISLGFFGSEFTRLCQAFVKLPALRKVDIDVTYANQNELFQALSKSKVTDLNTTATSYPSSWDFDTANSFVSWISTKPVRRIYLSRITFSESCAERILNAILASSTLRDIYSFSLFKSQFLSTPRPLPSKLKSLVVDPCSAKLLDAINPSLEPPQLTRLELTDTSIRDNDSRVPTHLFWTNTLSSLVHLRKLFISNYALSQVQCREIAHVLPRLQKLYLEMNGLDDDIAKGMIEALPRCKQLKTLCMKDQKLTHLSAISLAEAIPHCKSLKKLDIARNEIGSIGACALSSVLKYLDKVYLYSNCIEFDGAVGISRVLHETEHMKELVLCRNFLDTGVLSIIQALCKSKQREGVVDISNTLESRESYEEYKKDIAKLPQKYWCIFQRFSDLTTYEYYPSLHKRK